MPPRKSQPHSPKADMFVTGAQVKKWFSDRLSPKKKEPDEEAVARVEEPVSRFLMLDTGLDGTSDAELPGEAGSNAHTFPASPVFESSDLPIFVTPSELDANSVETSSSDRRILQTPPASTADESDGDPSMVWIQTQDSGENTEKSQTFSSMPAQPTSGDAAAHTTQAKVSALKQGHIFEFDVTNNEDGYGKLKVDAANMGSVIIEVRTFHVFKGITQPSRVFVKFARPNDQTSILIQYVNECYQLDRQDLLKKCTETQPHFETFADVNFGDERDQYLKKFEPGGIRFETLGHLFKTGEFPDKNLTIPVTVTTTVSLVDNGRAARINANPPAKLHRMENYGYELIGDVQPSPPVPDGITHPAMFVTLLLRYNKAEVKAGDFSSKSVFRVHTRKVNKGFIGAVEAGIPISMDDPILKREQNLLFRLGDESLEAALDRQLRLVDDKRIEPRFPRLPNLTFSDYLPPKDPEAFQDGPISLAIRFVNRLGFRIRLPSNVLIKVTGGKGQRNAVKEALLEELKRFPKTDIQILFEVEDLKEKWDLDFWVMPEAAKLESMHLWKGATLKRYLREEDGLSERKLYMEAHLVVRKPRGQAQEVEGEVEGEGDEEEEEEE